MQSTCKFSSVNRSGKESGHTMKECSGSVVCA